MGNLCASSTGSGIKNGGLTTRSEIIHKATHTDCDYRSTHFREIHEEYSVDYFESNMERFKTKWRKCSASQGGFINSMCFKDLFYIVKKHANLNILPELQVLVKKRRSLLHNKEDEEYEKKVEEIVKLTREANQKMLHEALEIIGDSKIKESHFSESYQ